jgi:hypothetical protein
VPGSLIDVDHGGLGLGSGGSEEDAALSGQFTVVRR